MLVFDTNILIYAQNEDSALHEACANRLEQAKTDPSPSFITWSICYEFIRATTHPSYSPSPLRVAEAWEFIENLLDSPSFSVLRPTDLHRDALAQTIRETPDVRGNRVHDMHIAALMREHCIRRICTLDAGFRRFPFLSITAP